MELRHLRYFLAVADTGNVTRAAERSFVAQSALSAQIARLEAELGSDLFVRSTRGVRLTAAGEALLPLATRLLSDADRLLEHMAALRGVLTGSLRIGMIQGAPRSLNIAELIADYHSRHSGIKMYVRTGASDQMIRDVAEGTLDIAIVATHGADTPAGLLLTPLVDDPLVAVFAATGALRQGGPISVQQLVEQGPFIHYRRGSGLRQSVTETFERAGIEAETHFELDQIADMVMLAAVGTGVTIVPASAVRPDGLIGASVNVLPLQDPGAQHRVSAVTIRGASPATSAFLELLKP
ncbi:LysR family transcriptional regulator [Mycobacterium kansasii]